MSMNRKSDGPNGTFLKPTVDASKDGRTKQSFNDSSNINKIVAKYRKTGMLENVRKNPGVFSDVSEIGDYQSMVSKIRFADEAFEQLPSALRSRFQNDPSQLIAFVSDDSNRDEAVKLGILPKPPKHGKLVVDPVVTVPAVPVVDPDPAPADPPATP